MPAPIDVSSCGGWEAVRTLAVAVGAREAARRLGLSEDAVRQRCTREGWLDECRPTVATPLPLSMRPTQPVASVATASQALSDALAEDSRASRLSMSRGLRRTAAHIEHLDPAEALEQAQSVKATASSLDMVHGWSAKDGNGSVRINIYAAPAQAAEPLTIDV